jgi:hypothetical protein
MKRRIIPRPHVSGHTSYAIWILMITFQDFSQGSSITYSGCYVDYFSSFPNFPFQYTSQPSNHFMYLCNYRVTSACGFLTYAQDLNWFGDFDQLCDVYCSLFLTISHNYRHKFYDLQKLFSLQRVWAQIEFGGWRWPKEGRQCMCVNIYWHTCDSQYTGEMLVVGRMIYGRLTSINMQGEEHWIQDTHGDMEPWSRPLKEKLFSC